MQAEVLQASCELIGWVGDDAIFLTQSLRKHRMLRVETLHVSAVWYQEDAYLFFY